MTASDTYYVLAKPSGNFASTLYYVKNADGSYTQVFSPMSVPPTATACAFVQHPESALTLQATVFKTLPVSSAFADYNYAPASEQQVSVSMPDNRTVTKGVVLMFTNADGSQLYSSSDPQIQNTPD